MAALSACTNPAGGTSSSTQSATPTGISAMVLDSVNGSSVAGVAIDVVDASNSPVRTFTTGSGGSVDITNDLAIGSVYSMTAAATGRASSAMLDYTAAEGTTVALYCPTIAMSNVSPKAPELVKLQYSTDGTSWTDWNPLASTPSPSKGFWVKASVAGVVAVEPTSWSGFGIAIDIDRMPTLGNGYSPSTYEAKSLLDNSGDAWNGLYITTAIFDFSSDTFTTGYHTLDLVAYDVANDRLETRLPFNMMTTNTSGPSLSSAQFYGMYLDLESYGRSNRLFSLTRRAATRSLTASDSASSYGASLFFDIVDSYLMPVKILGFEVYRSNDYINFAKIDRVNFGGLMSTADIGSSFSYSDHDASLALGTTYCYKVRAFSDDTHYSGYSPVLSASYLPPFTTVLTSPGNGSALSTSPQFSFSISNAALWSPGAANYFYFALFVRDKSGTPVFYGEYRYNFSQARFEAPGSYGSTGIAVWSSPRQMAGIAYSNGTITIDSAQACTSAYADSIATYPMSGLSLGSGVTYEWDVFGNWGGTGSGAVGLSTSMYSAYFTKAGSPSNSAIAYSNANTYEGGEATLNGSFEFKWQ